MVLKLRRLSLRDGKQVAQDDRAKFQPNFSEAEAPKQPFLGCPASEGHPTDHAPRRKQLSMEGKGGGVS